MARRDVERDARQAVTLARAHHTIWQRQQEAAQAATLNADKAARGYALGELGLDELLLARRTAQEAELAAGRAGIDAVEAVTRVRVDAHAVWHRHGADDADEATSPVLPALPALR
jgi:hypothetical protein